MSNDIVLVVFFINVLYFSKIKAINARVDLKVAMLGNNGFYNYYASVTEFLGLMTTWLQH